MRPLLTLVAHDLRQHLRDRSMLLFALVIPFALAYVFSLAFSGLEDVELEPVTVAVAAQEEDEPARALVEVLRSLSGEGLDVTVEEVPPDRVAGLVDDGTAEVGVVVPDGFAQGLGDQGSRVEVLLGPDAGLTGDVLAGLVTSTVQRMDADAAAIAGAGSGGLLPPDRLGALAAELGQNRPEVSWVETEVRGTTLSLTAGIVAGQAGMFLFFTVGFVVLTMLTEREWGTLARLRTMPVPRWVVPVAKAVVAVLIGSASTTALLVAGSLLLDGVDLGSWPVVLVVVVAVVAAATSVMFIILKVARTSEQASLAMSVVAISLGVGGGTFFQIPTTGWLGTLLQLNPVAALGKGLGITSGGGGLPELAPVLLTLLAFTAVVLVVARLLPGRRDPL